MRFANAALLIVAAQAVGAGQSSNPKSAFYEAPQLFVMTGFIANTTSGTWGNDFSVTGKWTHEKQQQALAAWNRGLGNGYDAEKAVLGFKQAGATGVIFYDKWHDGVVPHATKLTGFRTERDLVGPTIAALRKHGMKIVIYYSVGLDANPEPRFQDWVCRDESGRPMGRAFPGDWMSFHSPYRQYATGHLVEILRMYGRVDALWLDLYTQPVPSYDKYTRQAFEKLYGKTVEQATAAERTAFDIRTRRDFLVDIRRAVSAVQPDVALTFNGSGMADIVTPRSADQVDRLMDFFSMEGHRVDNIDRGARTGHNMDRPFEVGMLLNSSWYVPMADRAPPAAMNVEEAIVSAATAWTQGANVYAAMTPGHSGQFDENGDMRPLKAIGDWLNRHKAWLSGTTPYADVAIVRGTPSAELTAPPDTIGLWENFQRRGQRGGGRPGEGLDLALRRAGYFTQFAGSAFARKPVDWRAFRLVVLPENAVLSEATAGQLREYVQAGGRLLAFGHASLFDADGNRRANFALNDAFGADLAGELPGYKQFTPVPGMGIAAALRLNPGALGVKASTGRVLASWKSAGDSPAVIENQFGKGRAVYVSAAEADAAESDLVRELAQRLIGPPPVEVDSTRSYSFVMNRKGGDLVLYLMNRSTGSRAFMESGMAPDADLRLGPEQIRVSLNSAVLGEISGAEELPDGAAVRMSRKAGSVEIRVNASPSVTALRLKTGDSTKLPRF